MMEKKSSMRRQWFDWAVSAVSFVIAMAFLPRDYANGAFTGKGVVTGLYALRQCIPYVTMLAAILLRPIIEKSERNARLLPEGYIALQLVFSTVSVFSVTRSGQWVFRPAHSYLFFAHISDLEIFYLLLSFVLLVWGCVVIPYGKRIHSNIVCWVVTGLYLVSMIIEVCLQISSGHVYLSVVFWMSAQISYYHAFNGFSDLLTPENKMKLRTRKS